jgi:SagB-type dehydrogenase family enzyme
LSGLEKRRRLAAVLLSLFAASAVFSSPAEGGAAMSSPHGVVELPAARSDGPLSLEATLRARRSVRSYSDRPVALQEVAQLLWAAQGKTDPRGFRTAPSAGATFPLEVLVAAGNVTGLSPGVYRYRATSHDLVEVAGGDRRPDLFRAALSQRAVAGAPAVFIVTAVYERTRERYGERAARYVHMEAGHAAQNLCLQAVSLDLGAVVIGAFRDRQVQQTAAVTDGEHPLYLIPVGR